MCANVKAQRTRLAAQPRLTLSFTTGASASTLLSKQLAGFRSLRAEQRRTAVSSISGEQLQRQPVATRVPVHAPVHNSGVQVGQRTGHLQRNVQDLAGTEAGHEQLRPNAHTHTHTHTHTRQVPQVKRPSSAGPKPSSSTCLGQRQTAPWHAMKQLVEGCVHAFKHQPSAGGAAKATTRVGLSPMQPLPAEPARIPKAHLTHAASRRTTFGCCTLPRTCDASGRKKQVSVTCALPQQEPTAKHECRKDTPPPQT
jgi:hypothetical protein